MSAIHEVLKNVFGYSSFRKLQEKIIESTLEGKDTLVIMPTGGGKSICYQVPAISMKGTAIIISPLISLMRDQVKSLKENGVRAEFLNSSLSSIRQTEVESDFIQGKLDLLYISPEKLLSAGFTPTLSGVKVSMIAIDEAHCISQWGHDFRPEYTRLSFIKERFPDIPVMALTATADKATRTDIVNQLNLNEPEIFIDSFDRPNIHLAVKPGIGKLESILDFLKQYKDESGIIYCLSRKSTEQLAEKLGKRGYDVAAYHAGLSADERSRVQDDFIFDRLKLVCATIAFGMGIDKSNVRFVIHYNLPKNIESYYQEIGRSGRDGLPSKALLFYSVSDIMVLRSIIEENGQREINLAKLERMQQYADAATCRRKILLSYFGEHLEEDCGKCDNCENPPKFKDATVIAQKALSAIARCQEQIGMNLLIDVLRGSGRKEIFDRGLNKIKTYGAGQDISFRDWQLYLLQLLDQGLVEIRYDKGNSLGLTPLSEKVLFERKKVRLVMPSSLESRASFQRKKVKKKTKKELFDEGLTEEIKKFRARIALQDNVPAYVVFSDATLVELVNKKPTHPHALHEISGMGTMKIENFGEELTWLIVNFTAENFDRNISYKIKGGTYLVTLWKYKNGAAPEEIAREREVHVKTIFSHFARLYREGHDIDLSDYIDPEDVRKVFEAIKKSRSTERADLIPYLGENFDYYKIDMAVALFLRRDTSTR